MSDTFMKKPEDATHYMEECGDWLGTWFKKNKDGRWVGKINYMDEWDDNCGYEEELIKPIPVNYMHEAAPEMYQVIEDFRRTFLNLLEFDLVPINHEKTVQEKIIVCNKLLAEARGEL